MRASSPVTPAARPRPAPASRSRLVGAALLAVAVLVVAVAFSVAFGSRPIPLGTVLDVVLHPGRNDDVGLIVLGNRVDGYRLDAELLANRWPL